MVGALIFDDYGTTKGIELANSFVIRLKKEF